MADFQSRINQFRQGLNDQQDNYNKLAANMSQMGRSLETDKVAQHMEYVEKIGGSLTGAFAGAHATSKLYKKIQKARNARNAKNQNQKGPEDDGKGPSKAASQGEKAASSSEGQAQGEQADRTVQQTDEVRQGENDPYKDATDPSDRGVRDTTGQDARGGKPAELAKDLDDEEPPTVSYDVQGATKRVMGGGEPAPATAKPPTTAEPPSDLDLISNEQAATLFNKEPEQGGNVNPKSDTPSRPTATADGDPPKEDLPDVIGKEPLDDAASGIFDRAKSFIGKKIVGAVGEDVAGGLAEGVPILGEMVGLGMLIHGIVKAHRHEENSGGPQLTASNKEATEQSGGYSTDMLKGGLGTPSIV